MKKTKYFLVLLLVILEYNGFAQEVKSEKQDETGLYFAMGATYDWGSNANDFTKNKYNNLAEFGAFYKSIFKNNKYSFKAEYSSRFINSNYKFANGINGIVDQKDLGFNFKFGKTILSSNSNLLDIYLGPGVYTVIQKRIADPTFSTQKTINDGFASYWGMTAEFEIAGSVPLNKGRMGFATRIFIQPPFTIASKSEVPKFYHQGFSISWFISY